MEPVKYHSFTRSTTTFQIVDIMIIGRLIGMSNFSLAMLNQCVQTLNHKWNKMYWKTGKFPGTMSSPRFPSAQKSLGQRLAERLCWRNDFKEHGL